MNVKIEHFKLFLVFTFAHHCINEYKIGIITECHLYQEQFMKLVSVLD